MTSIQWGNKKCLTLCYLRFLFLSRFYVFYFDGVFYFKKIFFTIFSYNKCRVIRVRFGLQSNIKVRNYL